MICSLRKINHIIYIISFYKYLNLPFFTSSIESRDLDSKSSATRLMGVHKEPVLDFDWHNSLLVSGDKNGYVVFWDVNEAKAIKVRKCH